VWGRGLLKGTDEVSLVRRKQESLIRGGGQFSAKDTSGDGGAKKRAMIPLEA